ncbi:MAG: hypothetical protein AB7J35_19505 [Dehalococcoidia bacterium]
MTEPLQVGQFAIVDGEPVDRGPNAGVFRGKGPADDRAELFLLAEGTTPAGEAFAGHVISDLGQTFASLDMSLTGSLGRLFLEAERNLKDWNRKSIVQHRVSIGLSAFGRRGDQAVIAQAGPTVAFHLHHGQITEYFPEGDHARPIGVAPVQPRLTRISFDEGDRLLLLSSYAVRSLDNELIAGILGLPVEQVLPDLYRRVQDLRQVTAILVTGPGQAPAMPEEEHGANDDYVIGAETDQSGESDGGTFQPSLFIEDESESVVTSARAQLMEITPRRTIDGPVPMIAMEAPTPLLRASGESATTISRLAAEGAARAARSRAAVATIEAEASRFESNSHRPTWHEPSPPSPAPAPLAETPAAEQPLEPVASRTPARKAQSFSRGLVPHELPKTRPELLAEDLPLVAELAAGERARTARVHGMPAYLPPEDTTAISGGPPLVRPRDNMGGRWKGGGGIGGGRSVISGQLPPAWMVILGGLVILLIIAGFATVPQLLNGDDGEEVAVLMQGARQRILESQGKTDPAEKRELLTEAQAMLLDARDRGTTPETEQLISEVAGVISGMDNIQEPASVETIASLEQFGTKPVAVARMTVVGDAAFLLDVNSSQVVSVPLGGAEPKVVFQEDKDQKRAKPVAIAELSESPSGGPALVIADASNKLWAYSDSDGLRSMSFAAPDNLVVSDITTAGPDLFVLDAGQSTIFRFVLGRIGFSDPPLVAVKSDELSAARRLMVDGDYITSDADGTMHRFIADPQTAITFSEAGIDRHLVAPETAQVLEPGGEIAILDAPNDRIVVLRRDGGFDRQYRHPDFASASAFVIRNGEAFIFSGSQLRRVVF